MTEGQFASAVIRIWRLGQRIAKGGTKKQLAAARHKLWMLTARLHSALAKYEEPAAAESYKLTGGQLFYPSAKKRGRK